MWWDLAIREKTSALWQCQAWPWHLMLCGVRLQRTRHQLNNKMGHGLERAGQLLQNGGSRQTNFLSPRVVTRHFVKQQTVGQQRLWWTKGTRRPFDVRQMWWTGRGRTDGGRDDARLQCGGRPGDSSRTAAMGRGHDSVRGNVDKLYPNPLRHLNNRDNNAYIFTCPTVRSNSTR